MTFAGAVAAIEQELIGFDGRDAITDVLPEIRRLLDTDAVLVLTPVEAAGGLEVGRFQSLGFAEPERVRAAFADVFWHQPRRYAWYDPICPEPAQRNRVLEAHSLMGPGELERSYVYERVLRPCSLQQHRQPRVLLCDGASLLAWFGAFQAGAVTRRQLRVLGRLARPMRRRLALERTLEPLVRSAALAAALDQLGAPAIVLAGQRIVEANASGRALLAERRRELLDGRLETDAVPIRLAGCPDLRLLIVRSDTRDARIAAAVERAATRWGLGARSRHILSRVMRGDASATIAAEISISRRAVELHVTSLFERAGVGSRAELVAAALLV